MNANSNAVKTKVASESRKLDLENKLLKYRNVRATNEKRSDEADKIDIASALIETNPDELIPEDTTDKNMQKYYNRFKKECKNAQTSVLGTRQYKLALLSIIKHFTDMVDETILTSADIEISKSTSKLELHKKLAKAILMYHQFRNQIRANTSFA